MIYQHGGDIARFAIENGYRVDEVIDLSSNINPLKPKIDINFNQIDTSSYPNYDKLISYIAKNYSIKIDEFELYNGATVAISSLFKYLNISDINLYAPIYLEYKRYAILNGYNINYIDRFKDIYQDIKLNSLVVFVNPSTPDGEFYNLDRLMNIWIKREATIIIDESFLDFTTFKSAIRYLREYNRVYIIKSMTKFYSSAGVRIGLVISNSKNIDKIKESEPLWKISQFDSQYIQSVLRDREFPKISRELNNRYKKETIDILEGCNFVEEIYPSSANFILIRLKDIDSKEFQKRLTPYKIMVRDCFNFDFLDSRYVRVAIKDKKSIDRLRSAICEISI